MLGLRVGSKVLNVEVNNINRESITQSKRTSVMEESPTPQEDAIMSSKNLLSI
jgi:hypothetical protein